MKKEKIFMKSAGTRGYSPLARVLTAIVMMFTLAVSGAWAQEQWDVVWDFTAWSAETVTALKADAATSKLEGWSDVEKKADAEAGADPDDATKDNCFWSCSGTVNADGNLSANGAVIKEFQGLKFNSDYAARRELAIAVNYPSTSLGTYHGPAYLYLGGKNRTCFTIPGVKAGSKITIEVESHKTSAARGICLYKNSYAAENLIGEQFTPTTFEAKTWEIAEDCNVVVYNTNSCHIYTIKVKAPAAEPGKYTVAMAAEAGEGWTIEPAEATTTGVDKDTKITATYSGTKHVKSVTAVTKAAAPAALTLNLTSPAVGQVIGSDGKNYDYASLPTGVTALARICYVNGSKGLAMAMADEGKMAWSAAITTCEAHTPAFANGTWKLPTKAEWDNMISAAGGVSTLREAFSGIGGDNLQYVRYWSATVDESNDSNAYNILINDGTWATFVKTNVYRYVRAVLAW